MKRSFVVLKALIDHSDANLTRFADSSLKETLSKLPTISTKPSEWLQSPYAFLPSIHSSWLNSQQNRLLTLTQSPTMAIKAFAESALWKDFTKDSGPSLPFQGAQELSFGKILSLSPDQMTKLFHLLGLFDLSLELKKVVNSETLQSIQASLTKTQAGFLKKIKPSKVDFGSLHLDKWNKTPKTLQDALFSRGLNRLAKAFYTANSNIVWYFKRKLDKQTAENFSKLMTDLKNPAASNSLAQEVQQAITEAAL